MTFRLMVIGRVLSVCLVVLFSCKSLGSSESSAEVKGFANALVGESGYDEIITYDGVHSKYDMIPLSTYGLIVTKDISDQWNAALMLLARGVEDNNFTTSLEWGNLSYHPSSNFTIRVGKQKFPFYLNSDNEQIGVLYPWVRPPAEVYSLIPYSSYSGVSGDYVFTDIVGGNLTFELFKAQIDGSMYGTTAYRIKAMGQGAMFNYKKSALTLRGSYVYADVSDFSVSSFQASDAANGIPEGFLRQKIEMSQLFEWSLGASLDLDQLMIWYERASLNSDAEFFRHKTADYMSIGYYLGQRKYLPHLTFAQTLVHDASGFLGTVPIDSGKQKSVKFGFNYYFTPEVVLKTEWERTWIAEGTDTLTTNDSVIVSSVPHGMVDTKSIALCAIF